MKAYIIPTFIYPDKNGYRAEQMRGESTPLEEMDILKVVFYTVDAIHAHPYEGNGQYTLIMSAGDQYTSPLNETKIRQILEN